MGVYPPSDSPNSPEKKNEKKKSAHGEMRNVMLADDELERLKDRFPADWADRIERLSCYLASTGKRYKSHYATILNWARKDAPGEVGPDDRYAKYDR